MGRRLLITLAITPIACSATPSHGVAATALPDAASSPSKPDAADNATPSSHETQSSPPQDAWTQDASPQDAWPLDAPAKDAGASAVCLGKRTAPAAGSFDGTCRLDPASVQTGIKSNKGAFRLCFEESLRPSPALNTRVSLSFSIAADGTVPWACWDGSDAIDTKLASCVVRVTKSLRFTPARPPGCGSVTVTYPMIFDPSF